MIIAPFALAIAAVLPEPPAAELPMDVGPSVAQLFEQYVTCLARETYERRSDTRPISILAAEVRADCATAKERARVALAGAYRTIPSAFDPREEPDSKAANLLQTWDVRIEWVIDHGRQQGSPINNAQDR